MQKSRKIIVHCGLHKTGTTAIQLGLAKHYNECLDAGIYLFNGEKGNVSTHGLASDLCKGSKKSLPLLKRTVTRIRDTNKPVTFLSSEDFQSIITNRWALRRFVRMLKASGTEDITFLIYLRNPIQYLTSMYMTLLFFKHAAPFSKYFNTILKDGHYKYKKWNLHFDYKEIATALEDANVDFVFRDYHQLKNGDSVSDALTFLGYHHNVQEISSESRQGVTKNKRKFTRYCRHVLGDDITAPPMFKEFENRLSDTKLILPPEYKERILSRFEDSLAYTDAHFGTNILSVTRADVERSTNQPTPGNTLSYFDVFHENIKRDITPVLDQLNTRDRNQATQQIMQNWGWLNISDNVTSKIQPL